MTNNSQLLYDIENAIEALETLQGHSLPEWVTRTDEIKTVRIVLWFEVDTLLDDLRKKRSKVRKAVYDEETKNMEEWEHISTQGQAPHQPAEQDA